jgi:hypothetical protein
MVILLKGGRIATRRDDGKERNNRRVDNPSRCGIVGHNKVRHD